MSYSTTVVPVEIHRFRVLYTDGHVEDFLAARDDSTLREYMLKAHWGPKGPPNTRGTPLNAIAGVVDMGVNSTLTPALAATATDTPRPRKRIQKRPQEAGPGGAS